MKIQHRFPIGYVPGADLEILKFASDSKLEKVRYDAGRRWRYEVRFRCCGKEEIIAHRAIQDRIRRHVTMCRACGLIKGQNIKRSKTVGETPWVPVPWPPASTAKPKP